MRQPSYVKQQCFDVLTKIDNGIKRQIYRIWCDKCGAHDDMQITGKPKAPEFVCQKFVQRGWAAQIDKAKARCSECLAQKDRADSDAKDAEVMAEKAVTSSQGVVRDPTPDQRTKIRQLLDGHFDDAKGCYLDGYSDQRVGQELGVPWAMVTKIREAAYGPIRSDPEIEAIKGEILKIQGAIAVVVERVDRIEKRYRGAA